MSSFRTCAVNGAKVALCGWLFWWGMMACHEAGHIVSTVVNGGTIHQVILVPWRISETIRYDSAHPIVDVWAGPIAGILIPGLIAICVWKWKRPRRVATLFWGFCLLANGVYFGAGWLFESGDTGELIEFGFPIWPMVLFGSNAIVLGLAMWHVELEAWRNERRAR